MSDIERLRQIAAEATPGPWHVEFSGDYGDKSAQVECARWRGYLNTIDLGEDHATAGFIATARNEWDGLLDRLEAAETAVARVRELADEADHADVHDEDVRDEIGEAWIKAADLRAALADTDGDDRG